MARENAAEILITARDEATSVINGVAGQLGGLGAILTRLAGLGGGVGLAIAGIGAAAGGITLLGMRLADTVEQLDVMASRTGVNSERLQVMRQIITESGGDAESLTTALTFLNRSIGQGDPLLKQLGITTRDTFTAFMQLAGILASSDDDAKRTEVAFQLLGRGSADLIGRLSDLTGGFSSMDSKMRASGALITEEMTPSIRRLDEQADTLSRNWKGAMTRMQSATIPAANAIVQALNDMWDAMTGREKSPAEEAERKAQKVEERLNLLRNAVEAMQEAVDRWNPEGALVIGGPRNALGMAQIPKDYNEQVDAARKAIADYRAEIERLEVELRNLQVISGEVTYGPQLPPGGLPGADSLAGVTIGKAELDERARAIADIATGLRMLGANAADAQTQAAGLYDQLQNLQKVQNVLDLQKRLTLGPEVPQQMADLSVSIEGVARVLRMSEADVRGFADRFREVHEAQSLIKKPEEVFTLTEGTLELWAQLVLYLKMGAEDAANMAEAIERIKREQAAKREVESAQPKEKESPIATPKQVLEDLNVELERTLSIGGIIQNTFTSVWQALGNGFTNALQGIVSGNMTAGQAVRSIWKTVVDAVIQELARIASALIMRGILRALSASFGIPLPIFGATVSTPLARASSTVNSQTLGAPPQSAGDTYIIYGYDVRSVVMDLTSSNGVLRKAGARLAFAAE